MKKIISILAILFTTCGLSYGQGQVRTGAMPALKYVAGVLTNCTRDTTTNTDTSYLWLGNQYPFQYKSLEVRWTNTKISGTVGGTFTYQGSMDNSTYYTLKMDTATCSTCDVSTVTATNGTTNGMGILKDCPWKYVRVQYISSGTQTSYMTGTYWEVPAVIANLN